jgi:hypothetical protein
MVSRLRHNSTSNRSSSSGSKVARLRELTAARDNGNRMVGSTDNQKKRLHHGRNNFGAITPAASDHENSGVAFVWATKL